MNSTPPSNLQRERWKLTARLVRALEMPMLVLSGVWSVLLIIQFTRGLSPWLATLTDSIWIAFIAQFAIEFAAALNKRLYLQKRWNSAVSLAFPALRLLSCASRDSPESHDSRAPRAASASRACSALSTAACALSPSGSAAADLATLSC